MMNTAAIKRFLMLLSSTKGIEQAKLYQLLQAAERYYCLKNYKGQYEIGKTLEKSPYPFNLIGSYYQSLYLYKQGDLERALENIENVQSIPDYRNKSLLTLGGIHELEGNFDEAMKARLEASKSESINIVLDAALGITALLGRMGKNQQAIEYLEGLLSLLPKLGATPLYFDILNSYAVELTEVGKIDEATQIITPVVLSPYTAFYPNWLETQKEIVEKSKRRSLVAIEKNIESDVEQPIAKVLNFPTPKTEPAIPQQEEEPEKEPNFPHYNYIAEKFDLRSKVEDWINGGTEAEDLGLLMVLLAECDPLEKDMISERVIDAVFSHTQDSEKAKEKWRKKLLSKIK